MILRAGIDTSLDDIFEMESQEEKKRGRNKLAKLRRHASRVHFAKIHFGEIHFGKIHLKKYTLEKINFGGIHFDDCCTEGQPEIGNPKV